MNDLNNHSDKMSLRKEQKIQWCVIDMPINIINTKIIKNTPSTRKLSEFSKKNFFIWKIKLDFVN